MGWLVRIVSGGQTGVDRAALDAGKELGLIVGGWCPKGRLAEDGAINTSYPLEESPSEAYSLRTEWNVRDSNGTLILHRGQIVGGTAFTKEMAVEYGRPCLCIELSSESKLMEVVDWVERYAIHTLNVAGPRESAEPGIYSQAYRFLIEFISRLQSGPHSSCYDG
jgi:hypothetical protein